MNEKLHIENTKETSRAFAEKMKAIQEKVVADIVSFYKDKAVEAHLLGSMGKGTNDAFSDIDIWLTFEDEDVQEVVANRFTALAQFGEIVQGNEMQHNFPLDGVQAGVLYKVDGELLRVDFYISPLSSSRVTPGSKILFEKKEVERGEMIPEIKRTPSDPAERMTRRVTFLISMCFIAIKKIVRGDEVFISFLLSEFQKSEQDIPTLTAIPKESSFEMLRKSLEILSEVSNAEQKKAILEIKQFMDKVEMYSMDNHS